jgi:hypothetical protein
VGTKTWIAAALALLAGCGDPDVYYRRADGGAPTVPILTGAAGNPVVTGAGGNPVITGAAGQDGLAGSAGATTGAAGGRAGASGAAGASAAGAGGGGGTATAGNGMASGGTGGAAGSPLPVIEARLSDDFEAGTASDWIADTVDGDWAVVADGTGKVYEQQRSDSNLSLAIGGKLPWTDQVVTAKVKMITYSSTSAIVDLAVRYQDPDNYYFVSLKADGSLKIRKRVGSSTNDVAAYKSGTAIVKGTWYTLGLSAVGTTLTATFNGMMVATGTATDLNNGGIALGTQNTVAAFDDVTVTPP